MIKNYTFPKPIQKSFLCLLLALLFPTFISAQIHVDAFGMGGIYDDEATSIVMDSNKNVFIAGSYVDSVDFDPSSNSAVHYTVAAPNAFLAKYDQNGNYQWSVSIEGPQPIEIRDIALGNSAYIYAIGDFMGSASFDVSTSFTSMGVFDVFIAKYDTNGNFIWAKTFGGPAPDWGYSIAVDTSENIVATGSFLVSVDFDASAGNATLNSFGGSPDVFLVKYDSAGNFIWAEQAGGTSLDEGLSVETDQSNNIYLTGTFMSNSASFDSNTINLIGASDIFIAKYDENGSGLWAHALGGLQNDKGTALYIDENEVYLSGVFQSTANIDPTSTTSPLNSAGDEDVFLARFDTSGNYIWATSIAGNSEDMSNDIGKDIDGNVYVTGFFSSTADFSPGPGTIGVISLSSHGDKDIFVAKYDSAGAVISAMSIGGNGEDISNAFAIDDEHFYIAGSFSSMVDFDHSPNSNNVLNSTAGKSIFTSKYSFCRNNYEIVYDTICSGESFYVDSNISIFNSGSYRYNIASKSNSCDSVLTVHLEVTSINLNISQSGNVLSSNESQATFQWLDCAADTLISGETSASFTAISNGDYSLIITKGNCMDTTACFNVTSVGLNEFGDISLLEIYPNPSNGKVSVNSAIKDDYEIYNVIGEVVGSGTIELGENHLDLRLKPGIYFLQTEISQQALKLVIK